MKTIKNAIMLCVSKKSKSNPEFYLINKYIPHGELIAPYAKQVFNEWNKNRDNGYNLIDYSYYGTVNIEEE